MNELRDILRSIEDLLREHDELYQANMIHDALSSSEEDFNEFIVSNELWGGAGSVADQALMDCGRPIRRKLEAKMVELGRKQMKLGVTNVRTEMWTSAFSSWKLGKI